MQTLPTGEWTAWHHARPWGTQRPSSLVMLVEQFAAPCMPTDFVTSTWFVMQLSGWNIKGSCSTGLLYLRRRSEMRST